MPRAKDDIATLVRAVGREMSMHDDIRAAFLLALQQGPAREFVRTLNLLSWHDDLPPPAQHAVRRLQDMVAYLTENAIAALVRAA